MIRSHRAALAALAFVVSWPTSPEGTGKVWAAEVTPDTYKIRADDVLEIFVWQQEDLHREVVVQPDGRIILPLVRDIVVAGLTRDEVAAAIQQRLETFVKNPQVTVLVKRYGFPKIILLGQVAHSGPFDYRQGVTLLELLGGAGGFGEDAALSRVRLVRRAGAPNGRVVTRRVNVEKIMNKGDPDIVLEPGDVIYVPRTALAGFNKVLTTVLTPATLLIAVLAALAALRR